MPLSEAAEALRLLVAGDAVTTRQRGRAMRGSRARGSWRPRLGGGARPAADTGAARHGRARTCTVCSRGESADIRRLSRQRQVTVMVNMLPGTSQAAVQARMTSSPANSAWRPAIPAGSAANLAS